jgi:serine/threonine-protein kinase 11
MISGGKPATLRALTTEATGGPPRETHVRKVNDYIFRAKLGSGASSRVYLAVDARSGEQYAVKRMKLHELSHSSSGIAQLEREIRLMRLFDHPNILKLREVLLLESEREVFLVLEYAENGCLGAYVERGQRLSIPCICSIVRQIVGAIKHLHERGFVHEDIKPWNLLVDGAGRVLLADFGIGHSFQSAAMVVGSPAFQAPEALDDTDSDLSGDEEEPRPQKEDVWALGVTLFQLLFMRLPFQGENLYEIVGYIKAQPLEIPGDADPLLAQLLRGMLTIDPVKRFDADDILQNPLIAAAADRAADIPMAPPPVGIDGPVVLTTAVVCQPGFSYVGILLAAEAAMPSRPPFGSIERMFPRAAEPVFDDSSEDELVPSPILPH